MPIIVKNTTLIGPLDLIAPHSCRGCGRLGYALCDCCKKNIISDYHNRCPNCKKENDDGHCPNCPDLPPTFVIGERSDLIGTLVHDLKYNSVRALAQPLAEILDRTLPNFNNPIKIVPLPTIDRHIRMRGLDHTKLIAKKFAKIRHYELIPLLLRNQNTTQVGANRSARLTQATHAYAINPKLTIDPHATYLLLDDVWTTGASMRAAIQKLQSAHIKNIIVVILALSRIN